MRLCLAFLAVALLAGCGGGSGGSGSPIPNPGGGGGTPKTHYSVRELWYGATSAHSSVIQADLRRIHAGRMHAADASNAPILIVGPVVPDTYEGGISYSQSGNVAFVEAQVSPQPSASPSVDFSATTNAVTLTPVSPSPQPSGTPVPPTDQIQSNDKNLPLSASVTATVHVNGQTTSDTLPLYRYTAIALYYGTDPTPSFAAGGYSVNGSELDACQGTSCDVYLDGAQNIVFPYGATNISGDTPFNSVNSGAWRNTFTTLNLNTMGTTYTADGADAYSTIVFKTQSGAIAKLYTLGIMPGNGTNEWVEFASCVQSSCIDGST